MKKVCSFLLALCMLLSLGIGSAFAANEPTIKSAEEFQELLQKADAGDVDAMVRVGTVYSRGNFNSGVTRDFSLALQYFLKAADAGNTDVLMNIATIFEKGSAGSRDLERAYHYYKLAADAGIAGAQEKTLEPQFAVFHWKDNAALLAGKLGVYENIVGRDTMPYYLDTPVLDCGALTMELAMMNYSGWPFGEYGVFAQDLDGKWVELGRFQIAQSQTDGEAKTYDFVFPQPLSFRALAVVILEKGMDFTLYHADNFYVDKANVSAYSDTLPAPVFTPSEEQFPIIASHVYTSEYVNPWPVG